MYLEHYGLTEAPFRITPHTDFFFSGAKRGATLDALIYAIVHDEGIVKLSGEVGSGKTMLCRVLMERLPEQVVTIYLANPSLSRDDILFAIAEELELAVPDQSRVSSILRVLQDRLIELYGSGHQVVVLIDEAHAMPADTLEEIRLLSNLESNHHKLLQLVLFGQPELDATLARSDMRQLRERITQHFSLEPLVHKDVGEYIRFRMHAAGYRGPDVFTPPAIRAIARASLGLTRRINILADKALLAAFSENTHRITLTQARAAIRDARFAPPPWRCLLPWLGGAAIAAAALAFAWLQLPSDAAPAAPPSSAPATAAVPAVGAATAVAVAAPVAPPVVAAAAAPADNRPPATADDFENFGPLTRQHLQDTHRWLAEAPDDHWFVQVLLSDATTPGEVETFLARARKQLEPTLLRVYVADVDDERRVGIIYGDYPSREAATQAAARLPAAFKAGKPFPRQVKRLRQG